MAKRPNILLFCADQLRADANLARGPDGDALCRPWRKRLIEEARRVGDTGILDGDELASAPLDREAIAKLPVSGMGWRWF